MTPEELAACREAYCKEYGYDPEWDVVIDEDFQKAFSAGLFHKQAESAKEIADLKAQVEGMRNSVWVLTSEYNLYDQQGEYLEAIFRTKPTLKEIQTECQITEEEAIHILNGGGRKQGEDHWYNFREHVFPAAIEQEKPNDR